MYIYISIHKYIYIYLFHLSTRLSTCLYIALSKICIIIYNVSQPLGSYLEHRRPSPTASYYYFFSLVF